MSELNLNDDLVQDYLAECREHLATIENDLLTIEQREYRSIADNLSSIPIGGKL